MFVFTVKDGLAVPIFVLLILTTLTPTTVASDTTITNIVQPPPGPIQLNSKTPLELKFSANIANANQSMAIIQIEYNTTGFTYQNLKATMNGVNISEQFDTSLKESILTLNCSSIEPVNGNLQVAILFRARGEEGNYPFKWDYWFIAFQKFPHPPILAHNEGETKIETKKPGIPGFPYESIMLGLVLSGFMFCVIQRRQ